MNKTLSDSEKYKLVREIITEAKKLVNAGYGDIRLEKRVGNEEILGSGQDD